MGGGFDGPSGPGIRLHPVLQGFVETLHHLGFQLGVCEKQRIEILHAQLPHHTSLLTQDSHAAIQ